MFFFFRNQYIEKGPFWAFWAFVLLLDDLATIFPNVCSSGTHIMPMVFEAWTFSVQCPEDHRVASHRWAAHSLASVLTSRTKQFSASFRKIELPNPKSKGSPMVKKTARHAKGHWWPWGQLRGRVSLQRMSARCRGGLAAMKHLLSEESTKRTRNFWDTPVSSPAPQVKRVSSAFSRFGTLTKGNLNKQ